MDGEKLRNWIKKIVMAVVCYLAAAYAVEQMILNDFAQGWVKFFIALVLPLIGYLMFLICDEDGIKSWLKNVAIACVIVLICMQILPNPLEEYSYWFDTDYDEYYSDEYNDDYAGDDYQSSTTQSTSNQQNNPTISDNSDGFTYSLSDIGSLDGYFCLDPSTGKLRQIYGDLDYDYWLSEMAYVNGKELDGLHRFGYADMLPVVVNRTAGEQLIMVGDTWGSRSEKRKQEMELHALHLWGYANPYLLPFDMKWSEFETICGKNMTSLEGDFEAINATLADTNFRVVAYHDLTPLFSTEDPKLENYMHMILSDKYGETFTYTTYLGTEYVEQNVAMIMPIYWHKDERETSVVPIEKTKDGYMIVDISSLEAGYWWLDGQIPILIK